MIPGTILTKLSHKLIKGLITAIPVVVKTSVANKPPPLCSIVVIFVI